MWPVALEDRTLLVLERCGRQNVTLPMGATTEAIIEALTSAGYRVTISADSSGKSIVEAKHEAREETFIVRAHDLRTAVVKLGRQAGLDRDD